MNTYPRSPSPTPPPQLPSSSLTTNTIFIPHLTSPPSPPYLTTATSTTATERQVGSIITLRSTGAHWNTLTLGRLFKDPPPPCSLPPHPPPCRNSRSSSPTEPLPLTANCSDSLVFFSHHVLPLRCCSLKLMLPVFLISICPIVCPFLLPP